MSGSLFIIAAPSGAGKSTLVTALLDNDPALTLSVSHTTRAPRRGEVEGRDYHFVDREKFLAMRDRGEFLESAEVHGNLYGTSRIWLESQMAAGRDIICEIDCQGAEQLRSVFPEAVAIFILPPSFGELESRLRGRGTEAEDVIARRLATAAREMRMVGRFDYAIINFSISEALARLQSLVIAARQRVTRLSEAEHDLFVALGIHTR